MCVCAFEIRMDFNSAIQFHQGDKSSHSPEESTCACMLGLYVTCAGRPVRDCTVVIVSTLDILLNG